MNEQQKARIVELGRQAESALLVNAMLRGCLLPSGASVPPSDRGCILATDASAEAFRIATSAARSSHA